MKDFEPEYIYAITPDYKKFKLGRTSQPQKRISQIQTANGSDLKVIHLADVFEFSVEMEIACHWYFKNKHIRGEWFHCFPKLKNSLKSIFREDKLGNSIELGRHLYRVGWRVHLKETDERLQRFKEDEASRLTANYWRPLIKLDLPKRLGWSAKSLEIRKPPTCDWGSRLGSVQHDMLKLCKE
jgi:hypothetical protein